MTVYIYYDDGKPQYMSAIDQWTEPRDPAWRISYRPNSIATVEDVTAWLNENCMGNHDCEFRFNSGDPMLFISLSDERDVLSFRLRWT